jgi:hypothetical protein
VPADYSDNIATSTAIHLYMLDPLVSELCASTRPAIHLHMPDPPLSELCASNRPPTWVDPMLEEVAVSRPVGATATQEEEASLVDKLAMISPTLSHVRGQVTSLQGEQPSIVDAETCLQSSTAGHAQSPSAIPIGTDAAPC